MLIGYKAVLSGLVIAFAGVSMAGAHGTYTGYSGAPGSSGTCASSCHGGSGGTITANGFPAEYSPGANYVITIGHTGAAAIVNFNTSCRVGTSSTTAGTIAAGTGTSVYSVASESNGVHFTTAGNQTSGTFTWTAPAKGTGMVKLYVAGIQTSNTGPNTAIVQTATEATTAVLALGSRNAPAMTLSLTMSHKAIFALPAGFVPADVESFNVFDMRGNAIRVPVTGNATSLEWNGTDSRGRFLPAGAYLFVVRQGQSTLTGKILLTR